MTATHSFMKILYGATRFAKPITTVRQVMMADVTANTSPLLIASYHTTRAV